MSSDALRHAVVAVDGPSGSGKSSASRGTAVRLGLRYLDTGAMYRAVTLWVLQHGIDPRDPAAVAQAADRPVLEPGTDPTAPGIRCDGIDVSAAIRSPEVTAAVSAVSAVPEVRSRLVALQREAVAQARAAGTGIVVEGRDIGGVVLPDADVKVFLVASAAERARRRALQDAIRDGSPDPHGQAAAVAARVEQELARRDAHDAGRDASPLRQAEGALVVDGTDRTLEGVIDAIVALVEQAVTAGRTA